MNYISKRKVINYGTDYELCETGTDHCSYCPVLSGHGPETGTGCKGQVYSTDFGRREHCTVCHLGAGYQ